MNLIIFKNVIFNNYSQYNAWYWNDVQVIDKDIEWFECKHSAHYYGMTDTSK